MQRFTLLVLALISFVNISFASIEIPFFKPYKALLQEHVTPTTLEGVETHAIDYKAWQKDPRHKQAMQLLTEDDLSKYLSRELQMSFWINAYNLLVIDLVIREVPKESIQNLGGIVGDPWNEYSWVIDVFEYNLNYIQHQILKPLREVRVHFALSCGAISCPTLRNEPYGPDKIYSQLEEQTKKFLNNEKIAYSVEKNSTLENRIKTNRKAYISELFLFHQQQFNGGNPRRFLQRYKDMQNVEIEDYLPFNWNLNVQKGKEANPALRNPLNKSISTDAKK